MVATRVIERWFDRNSPVLDYDSIAALQPGTLLMVHLRIPCVLSGPSDFDLPITDKRYENVEHIWVYVVKYSNITPALSVPRRYIHASAYLLVARKQIQHPDCKTLLDEDTLKRTESSVESSYGRGTFDYDNSVVQVGFAEEALALAKLSGRCRLDF